MLYLYNSIHNAIFESGIVPWIVSTWSNNSAHTLFWEGQDSREIIFETTGQLSINQTPNLIQFKHNNNNSTETPTVNNYLIKV